MRPELVARPILRLHHLGMGPALPTTADMLTFLDRMERQRAARYATPSRAVPFVTGRYLLRLLAADLVKADPRALVSDFTCAGCGRPRTRTVEAADAPPDTRSDHGRPGYLLDGEPLPLALSLSRTADAVLLGALDLGALDLRALDLGESRRRDLRVTGARAARTSVTETRARGTGIGVDVDAVSGVVFEGFDDVALSDAERNHVARLPRREQDGARARLWVRKEALVKARGTGFGWAGPADVEVLTDPDITDLEECDGVTLAHLGLVAAVAVV